MFGALDEYGVYVAYWKASKQRNYACRGCGEAVIFRQGAERRPHFAHKSTSRCSYYEGGEGHRHYEAKMQLAELIRSGAQLEFRLKCNSTSHRHSEPRKTTIRLLPKCRVEVEYPFQQGRCDIAIVQEETVWMAIEICDTHKTVSPRPELWFELDATSVLEKIAAKQSTFECQTWCGKSLCNWCQVKSLPIMRQISKTDCSKAEHEEPCIVCGKVKYQSTWIDSLHSCVACCETQACLNPEAIAAALQHQQQNHASLASLVLAQPPMHKVGAERGWHQTIPCVRCQRVKYNPIYVEQIQRFVPCCKLCTDAECLVLEIQRIGDAPPDDTYPL